MKKAKQLTVKPVLDPFTFGDSRACQNLASILNELGDGHISHKVCKIVGYYHRLVKNVLTLPDHRAVDNLLVMMRRDVAINKLIDSFPHIIKTHTRNVIIGPIKEGLRNNADGYLLGKAEAASHRAYEKWLNMEENEVQHS